MATRRLSAQDLEERRRAWAGRSGVFELQWPAGPLVAHRLCGRASSDDYAKDGEVTKLSVERYQGEIAREFLHVDDMWDHRYACHTISCRPGDPYGCSMRELRAHLWLTNKLLRSWTEGGGSLALLVLEAVGVEGERLASVLDRTRAGAASLSKNIRRRIITAGPRKGERATGGLIKTLTVRLSSRGEWIVRRWLFVAMDDNAAFDRLMNHESTLARDWGEFSESDSGAARLLMLEIGAAQVLSAAQLSLDYVSELDPLDPILSEGLLLGLPGVREGTDPREMSVSYYTCTDLLKQEFADLPLARETAARHVNDVGGGSSIKHDEFIVVPTKGEARFMGRPSQNSAYRELAIPVPARPFLEYALTMKAEHVWDSYKPGTAPRWSAVFEGLEREVLVKGKPTKRRFISNEQKQFINEVSFQSAGRYPDSRHGEIGPKESLDKR